MKLCSRAALFALLVIVLVSPVLAQPRTATITLGRDPEPPFCVLNPGGTVDIFWDIQHETTPDYVFFKLEDPTRTIILDSQTYPGGTGLTISRSWTVPSGMLDGKYWVRVEYWSLESSNEANAEVTFYVCTNLGNLCVWKYRDANCNGVLDPSDPTVPDWWIKIRTPNGDNISRLTDYEGKVCWYGVPTGTYTVYDYPGANPPAGWQVVGPSQYTVEVTGTDVVTVSFLNVKYDDCFGACCLPSGACVEVSETACAEQLGAFYGLGSLCAGIACPQPGACCNPETGACTFVLEAACPPGWVWISGMPCEPVNPCAQPGACCDPVTGACTYVLQANCPTGWLWISGVPCTPVNPCPPPPPEGACCDPEGNCTITTEANCQPPSIWHPEWTSCNPNYCPPPVPVKNTTWGNIKATYR